MLPSQAAVYASPDAALLDLCRQYEVAYRRLDAILEGGASKAMDAKAEPVVREMNAMLDQLRDMRAVTTEGIIARARVLYLVNGDQGSAWDEGDLPMLALRALLRDVSALPGMPPEPGAAA